MCIISFSLKKKSPYGASIPIINPIFFFFTEEENKNITRKYRMLIQTQIHRVCSNHLVNVPSEFRIKLVYSAPHCITVLYCKSLQSCPTLSDPIDGSPLGSPIPGILQARTLEWVAVSFSYA